MSGWAGFWIGLGLLLMWPSSERVDCWLKVPGACEALAAKYIEQTKHTATGISQ